MVATAALTPAIVATSDTALAQSAACTANQRFGRMFPSLPAANHQVADLQRLGALTTETTHIQNVFGTAEPSQDESDIPAGYTYIGQFIDHDITLDDRPNDLINPIDINRLVNRRTPSLDLDSVYANGPTGSPQLYEADGMRLKLGAPLTGARTDPGARDLLRGPNGRALLGDGRNDENRITASLHSIFTRYHNEIVTRYRKGYPSWTNQQVFEAARRYVTLSYQWAILTDFLPQMSSSADVARVVTLNAGRWTPTLRLYNACNGSMPIEFSGAAYRWHTMVRDDYVVNDQINDLPIFDGSNDPRKNLAGGTPSPSDFAFDWDLLLKMTERSPQEAYKLDNSLVPGLGILPSGPAGAGPVNLSVRNLLRGRQLALPSGQAIARHLGITPLRDDQIIVGPALAPGAPTQALTSVSPTFANNAPLWSYVFAESVNARYTVRNGRIIAGNASNLRLGPVGARIVNETIVGLMTTDPTSLVNTPNFQLDPSTIGSDGIFGFDDIVRTATGMTDNAGTFELAEVRPGKWAMVNGDKVGWKTSERSNRLEFWGEGFRSMTNPGRGGAIELNSTAPHAIWRDFKTTPGTTLQWEFWHRGVADNDTVVVHVQSPGAPTVTGPVTRTIRENHLGPVNPWAGTKWAWLYEKFWVTRTVTEPGGINGGQSYTSGTTWTRYSGTYVVPAGQTTTRITLTPTDAGSVGNLVDDVIVRVIPTV